MDVCKIGKGKGGKRQGPPRVGSHPHVRNPEKYPDCITDLICWGGNTDVLPMVANTLGPPLAVSHVSEDCLCAEH